MNVVGKVGSFISQGMYSVATPFHPFGGAVDIIVVKQQDGTFRSTPWYVRFGKFQGVLKGAEKLVRIEVNGVEANFHMHLDNSGEAYFVREVDSEGLKDSGNLEDRRVDDGTDYSNIDNDFKGNDYNTLDMVRDDRLERVQSDSGHIYYEFQDEQSSLEGSLEFSEYGSSRYDTLDSVEHALESQNSNSEVVLVSVDGHILTAPISSSERNGENVELNTPQFHLGPGGETAEEYNTGDYLSYKEVGIENECEANSGIQESSNDSKEVCIDNSPGTTPTSLKKDEVFKSCLELSELAVQYTNGNQENTGSSVETEKWNHKKLPAEAASHEISSSGMDHEGSASMPVEVVNNDQELSQEGTGLDTAVESKPSGPEGFASEDEYSKSEHDEPYMVAPIDDVKSDTSTRLEISLCGNLLHAGMGSRAAENAFNANLVSLEEFKLSPISVVENENLIIRLQGKYLPWSKAAPIILGMAAFVSELPVNPHDAIPVEVETPEAQEDIASILPSTPSRRWRLWPIPFRRVKTLEHTSSNSSNEEIFVDSQSATQSEVSVTTPTARTTSPRKQIIRSNVPTTDQIASLNLKEGQNMVNFIFSTRVLGTQKVEAHIYLWKWNTKIVISDVDGTITKSDVLGQFMPLVGRDWTHIGITRLFSAIKENGYQLLFLSARAIVQAYLTKSFLFNLKQDGKSLPNGPVVISPDGLFPSLYREVIRRAPHEFKIACLEDIKALFPTDYNPFYAGFGNRDTDELSYRKIGIPKGKIFIINPKGEVAINHRIDVKSYTSLHTLVHDMFPPTSLVEQEDYNSWNYWKMPLPEIDNL